MIYYWLFALDTKWEGKGIYKHVYVSKATLMFNFNPMSGQLHKDLTKAPAYLLCKGHRQAATT